MIKGRKRIKKAEDNLSTCLVGRRLKVGKGKVVWEPGVMT